MREEKEKAREEKEKREKLEEEMKGSFKNEIESKIRFETKTALEKVHNSNAKVYQMLFVCIYSNLKKR